MSFAIFVSGLACGQENSPYRSSEWNAEKQRAWAVIYNEFPEYTSTEPALRETYGWIQQWDEWAKVNDPELYNNPMKPLIYARRQKAAEIESATKAAKHAAETEERRKALAQEAATYRQANVQDPQQVILKQPPTGGNSGRGGLTDSALGTIWLGGTIIIILSLGVAWGLHWIIRPRHGAKSAISFGRKWAAWAVAISTISMLPSFFRKLDGSSLALWAIGVVGWGILAFLIGWIIGLFKFRRKTGEDPSPAFSPPPLTEALAANTPKNNLEKTPDVQALGKLTISQDARTKNQESPLNMNNNEFEVEIPEGQKLENGYVEMGHNTQYSLNLKNHRLVPCDAEVTIDGIHVGTWRIESRGEIQIERPVHDTGYFTFFQVGTEEADMAGITKNPDNGLISVTFKPKKERFVLNAGPLPGATGLSGESSQRFVNAIEIEHDMSRAFTIHIRLISKQPNIRPLAPRSTPIPPPVG
ncbi:MAG: hypothetical protein WED15_00500 [Akkermansiaceae bacterium]